MPDASPRSVTGSARARPVRRRAARSASRAAAGPGPPAPALLGSCSASQRSLVTVNEALGTLPVCWPTRPARPARRSALRGRRGRAQVVPQQRGPDDLAVLVQHHHAVLLRRHRDRVGPVQQALPGLLQRGPPGRAGRLRCRPGAARCPGPAPCRPRPGTAAPWWIAWTNPPRLPASDTSRGDGHEPTRRAAAGQRPARPCSVWPWSPGSPGRWTARPAGCAAGCR